MNATMEGQVDQVLTLTPRDPAQVVFTQCQALELPFHTSLCLEHTLDSLPTSNWLPRLPFPLQPPPA